MREDNTKIFVRNQINGTVVAVKDGAVNGVVVICRGTATPSKQISPWNR